MRGSVVQGRWIISVALVGLISILLATQTANWNVAVSAQTTASTLPVNQQLQGCANLPTSLSLNPGVTVNLAVDLVAQTGSIDNALPEITYEWSSSGGSVSPSNTRTTVFTAPTSGGSFHINLVVRQSGSIVCNVNINVSVVVPPVPPAPTATPVNPPGPVPTLTTTAPNTNIAGVTPAEGGTVRSTTRPGVEVNVPRGAVSDFAGVQVTVVDPTTAPAPGANLFRIGSTVVDVKITNSAGTPVPGTKLTVPAEVCLPFTAADASGSFGGPSGLALWRYDDNLKQWVQLTSTFDPVRQVVCARTSQFSLVALGLTPSPLATATPVPQATATPVGPTPTAKPPVTGDFAAGPGLLAVVAVAGLAFVGLGLIALRRSKRSAA
jgi:hypothetical protein